MRRFKSYTVKEFKDYVENMMVKRPINHIQLHHTWKPTKSDYINTDNKERIIWGMWNYHVNENGWSDIGQHFTVSPDGLIWDGRSLDRDPAGIYGHNDGGICIEMIGNFDTGHEDLEGEQLKSAVELISILLKKFNLYLSDIVFHREYSSKTCPGSSIDKNWILGLVDNNMKFSEVSPWALQSWKKAVQKGINDGIGPKDPVTEEQLMVFFDKLGLLD